MDKSRWMREGKGDGLGGREEGEERGREGKVVRDGKRFRRGRRRIRWVSWEPRGERERVVRQSNLNRTCDFSD